MVIYNSPKHSGLVNAQQRQRKSLMKAKIKGK